MKKLTLIGILLMLSVSTLRAQTPEKIRLENKKDSLSYVIGYLMGRSFNDPQLKGISNYIQPGILSESFMSTLRGEESLIDEDKAFYFAMSFMETFQEEQKQLLKAESDEFLKENKKKPGIITTPSGLQYQILKEGSGNRAQKGQYAKVRYQAQDINGKVLFESEEDDDEDDNIVPINDDETIDGLYEGLLLMSPGSHYIFYIPYELAFGEDGYRSSFDPYAVVVFDIEILEVLDNYSPYGFNWDEDDDEDDLVVTEISDSNSSPAPTVHDAGDYTKLTGGDLDYEMKGIYVEASRLYNDHLLVFTDEEMMVLDADKNTIARTPLALQGYWSYDPVIYEPKNPGDPVFIVVDVFSGSKQYGADVIVFDPDMTPRLAGTLDMAAYDEDSYSGKGRISEVLYLHSRSGGAVDFVVHGSQVIYNPNYSAIPLPAEDIHYSYKQGKLEIAGMALQLSSVKRAALMKSLQEKHQQEISQYAYGDLNGDNQNDIVYSIDEGSSIYVVLCDNYVPVKTIELAFDSEVIVNTGIIRNGEFTAYVLIDGNYREKTFRLQGEKLIEIQ